MRQLFALGSTPIFRILLSIYAGIFMKSWVELILISVGYGLFRVASLLYLRVKLGRDYFLAFSNEVFDKFELSKTSILKKFFLSFFLNCFYVIILSGIIFLIKGLIF